MRPSVLSLALFAGALISVGLCAANAAAYCPACEAGEGPDAAASAPVKAEAGAASPGAAYAMPTPLELPPRAGVDKTSYGDVFRILGGDNPCSRFFGGPRKAVTVFNQLALQLRKKALGARRVAVVMSGDYANYRDALTGASYRLFDEAVINVNGPFPLRAAPPGEPRQMIGRFPTETRQAKALILLHELGHLIRGEDGKWLLPEDGGDSGRSEQNTWAVQSRCVGELLALGG